MESIEVIVLLYNGKKHIPEIEKEFHNQKTDLKKSLHYIVTATGDGTEEELTKLKANFSVVKKEDFSHSLTREKAILESKADAVVLLTQDCRLVCDDALDKLARCLNEDVKYAYLRQVNSNKTLERYSRMINYPKTSLIKDQTMIPTLGLNTFFASDACAIVDRAYFQKVNGFDHLDLPTNEDMYYARKVILAGKKVEYCADTYVDHTHKFTLKQTKQRYYLFGQFFGLCPEFNQYHATDSGLKLAFRILGLILKEFNIKALFMFVPNMLARFFGKRKGQKSVCSSKK